MFRDMGEADGAAASIIDNSSQDRLAALIQAREYYGFLAEYEGEVIAGGGVWLRPLLPRPGALQGAVEAYVLNVYTEPAHRRNGVARAIMGRYSTGAANGGWPASFSMPRRRGGLFARTSASSRRMKCGSA